MQNFWQMLTTTLGSAAVIAAISMVFTVSKRCNNLNQKNKTLYQIVSAILFGLLSMYASASAIQVDGALCNCRNLAPLFAGLISGPIAGIGSALIGGLFRFFAYGGDSALACMLACFLSGIIGTVVHLALRKKRQPNIITGIICSLVAESCHMLILCIFGHQDIVEKLALPIIISNVCGMAFCMFLYLTFKNREETK